MMDMMKRISQDGWEEKRGPLSLSGQRLELELNREEVREGFFEVSSGDEKPAAGYVLCMEERMECLTPSFSGMSESISWRFDSAGMREGDERSGRFVILSDCGEYELPFHVKIQGGGPLASPDGRETQAAENDREGESSGLFHFVRLARENWQEAEKLFYSSSFVKLLSGNDRKYRNLYKGLSRSPGNGQNLEEFLVSAGKKPPVEYFIPAKELVVNASGSRQNEEQLCEMFVIKQSGWGYTRLRVEAEGEFLSLEKSVLSEEDFLGNQCSLPVFVSPSRLHGGKNFGRLRLRTSCGTLRAQDGQETDCLEITVAVITERPSPSRNDGRRREWKRMTAELIKLYQELKMKRLNTVQWQARTAEVVERLHRLNDRAPEVKLYQAHLLITEERFEEAGRILKQTAVTARADGAELYCYYLYLSSLYQRDERYTAKVAMNVEEAHRANRESWRIAWLQLYLSPALQRSASRKWLFLEDQFEHGAISPVLYLEAVQLLNFSPTLIMKLGAFERQVLHYGARCGIISPDLAGHLAYLAEKEKYFSRSLFDTLRLCYEKRPDASLLQAICSLLIKGNKAGPEWLEWYRLGVEQDLRVTRLYEYFMLSVDLEQETEIPRAALMYFAYQSNLDQDRCAYLYAYVQKHRDEFPELYQTYRGQMERFLLQQLYRGRMSRDLACLYQSVLEDGMLTKDNCRALAQVLFLQQLDCEGEDIRQAVVVHAKLRGEQTWPVENGRAYVEIYDRDYEIFLEDEEHNRYSAGRAHTLTRLMNPALCMKQIAPFSEGVLGCDLYFCEIRKGKINVTKNNASRLRYLAGRQEILPALARAVRMALLRYYYEHDNMEELDLLLQEMERPQTETPEVYETVGFLVLRSFYEKAYEWLAGLDLEKEPAEILLRLSSRLLESGQHEGEERLMAIACSAFFRGKYDSYILSWLAEHYEGSSGELLQIRKAADDFAVDTYRLTERLLIQLLFTGDDVMKRTGLLRRYVGEGGRTDLEEAFLHRASGLFLMEGEEMAPYVLRDIARVEAGGEALTDMCALAYLEYYSRHREERNEETDGMIRRLGERLINAGMKLPLFQEYADILDGAEMMLDKTMVVYKGSGEHPVSIHYRIERPSAPEAGHGPMRVMQMQHVYAGIYSAQFVLFAGESLQYYITETFSEMGDARLDEGELKAEENLLVKGTRYGLLNDVISHWLIGEKGESQELLEQYLMTEWMTDGLFEPIKTDPSR
ncbi:MAG TPA: hypothetical protein H9717_03975 [Candidatus Eisenbergiella merdipullorum]|uniref:DUF5717 domain-containing protein n=1 Tax=Candidatus Eisenbergiella merdipullorum TaxID=2838553 RepID=A0A9D2KY82_9FIRM|nr:hypothetical protein [Candidatus Eisenbergiella merdipullorum]